MNTLLIQLVAFVQSRVATQEKGAAAVEYILLATGIAVTMAVGALALGGKINVALNGILP